MSNLNQDSPLSEKIKELAQAQMTDDQRLQVLIYLTAELAERVDVSVPTASADDLAIVQQQAEDLKHGD